MTRPQDPTPVHLELDCTDLLCPMPVIELARHFSELEAGDVVAVLTRDVAARTDIPAWCRMRGQEYLGEETTTDQVPRHLVRKVVHPVVHPVDQIG